MIVHIFVNSVLFLVILRKTMGLIRSARRQSIHVSFSVTQRTARDIEADEVLSLFITVGYRSDVTGSHNLLGIQSKGWQDWHFTTKLSNVIKSSLADVPLATELILFQE